MDRKTGISPRAIISAVDAVASGKSIAESVAGQHV
jgi:hypothetical protein